MFNIMLNCKVKTKVHDPPNLILGVDIRCLAEETCTFDQKKVVTQPYYFLDFWHIWPIGAQCA